jgi:eukaryotic-like serine/threonine-protein kinase
MRHAVGKYTITGLLGEGGMGIVYAARDEQLDRAVAIKMVRHALRDPSADERLRREARIAAAVNHPAVCQLYEIGEEDGELFVAMELLQGESLAARLARGRPGVSEVLTIALGMLAGLDALHRSGVIHRDLKPSNVFLTPQGVKLLDFGVASHAAADALQTATRLTSPGMMVGTPQYAAPEQLRGEPMDVRSDIFSAATVVYEMLAGRPPFSGASPVERCHAILHEPPAILAGGPVIVAVDRVLHRALAKRPDERPPSAEALAHDLRAALLLADTGALQTARAVTRLVALPLRVLRPDPETEFLAFSLPDAITSSLSTLQSLVVRSSLAASRVAGPPLDLARIAADADVDVVLAGTMLRAGDQLRVATQLLEAPSGTVLWSHTAQAPVVDLFALQDELTHRIVEALAVPLTARERRLMRHDVPASPEAYEQYLRGNELIRDPRRRRQARDLYLRSVEQDPHYAPSWAALGRAYWLLSKYTEEGGAEDFAPAEHALKRALELNADLSAAASTYAQLEVDLGRAAEALVRLVRQARARSADAELFAGLVHVCRYCGLLRASIAAFEQARRIDPRARSSIAHTFFMLGEYERVVEFDTEGIPYVRNLALVMLGREAEALESLRSVEERIASRMVAYTSSLRLLLEGDTVASSTAIQRLADFRDPEARFYVARHLARLGETERALSVLHRSVADGFFCLHPLVHDPWLDPLRGMDGFAEVVRLAESRHRDALLQFLTADGHHLLGTHQAV